MINTHSDNIAGRISLFANSDIYTAPWTY